MADFNFCSTRIATGAAISDPNDVSQIIAAGITFVVDARAEFDDGILFAQYPALAYKWNPTQDDGTFKPVDYWQTTLEFALPLLAQPHQKGLFHCAAGVNRGPSNAFCVLVAQGWPADLAEARIRTARPQVNIAYKNDAAAAVLALGYVS